MFELLNNERGEIVGFQVFVGIVPVGGFVIKCYKINIMKKNMGKLDRILRIIVALILAALYFTDVITGTIGIIVVVFAGIMFLTSVIGNCPPYSLMGINTCKVKEQKQ